MGEIYSPLKALRFPQQLDALQHGRVVAPVHIRIKPINACNHHCWYCAYRADNLQLGDQMSLKDRIPDEKMSEIVDDIVSMGVKSVTFTGGGEPLLYKTLPEVIERLAQGGVRVAALSNGALLDGPVARALSKHGTWVRVSIDAWDGESYSRSRGVTTSEYDRVIGNLKRFAASGSRCVLGISFIVGEANADHIAEFCAQAKAIGVSTVKLSACVVGNSAAENNAYHSRIEAAVRRQIDLARKLEGDGFSVVDHYHKMDERFDKTYTRCPYLQFLTVIGADQAVYTCQDKAYTDSGRLGSIKDRSFKDFWFSAENAAKMRALDPSRDCRHHCVSHTKNQLLERFLALEPGHSDFV